MKEEIFELYNNVFDENQKVKVCRREACQKLIRALKEICPEGDFGDEMTGFMKSKNIISYMKSTQYIDER